MGDVFIFLCPSDFGARAINVAIEQSGQDTGRSKPAKRIAVTDCSACDRGRGDLIRKDSELPVRGGNEGSAGLCSRLPDGLTNP